jgi:hypothetical protein
MWHTTEGRLPTSPIDAARVAIWRLFQEGYVDEDMATASLLAVDLGTRRRPANSRPRRARPSLSAQHQPHQTPSTAQRQTAAPTRRELKRTAATIQRAAD